MRGRGVVCGVQPPDVLCCVVARCVVCGAVVHCGVVCGVAWSAAGGVVCGVQPPDVGRCGVGRWAVFRLVDVVVSHRGTACSHAQMA